MFFGFGSRSLSSAACIPGGGAPGKRRNQEKEKEQKGGGAADKRIHMTSFARREESGDGFGRRRKMPYPQPNRPPALKWSR